ncbi:MAG: hypothetical protein ACTJHU_04040 [Mycetocola sp.]
MARKVVLSVFILAAGVFSVVTGEEFVWAKVGLGIVLLLLIFWPAQKADGVKS